MLVPQAENHSQLRAGLYIQSIAGTDVASMAYTDVLALMRAARRPTCRKSKYKIRGNVRIQSSSPIPVAPCGKVLLVYSCCQMKNQATGLARGLGRHHVAAQVEHPQLGRVRVRQRRARRATLTRRLLRV